MGGRHRRIAVAVASAVSLFPLTAAASATGILPSSMPWLTDGGSSCEVAYSAAVVSPDGLPLGASYVDPATRHAVSEASRFLVTFDYNSIDRKAAIAQLLQDERSEVAPRDDVNEAGSPLSDDDLELTAVYAEVRRRVEAHLLAEGISPDRVGLGQTWICK